eukprot:TRINITY_DN414_c0_g1_i1.p1 TRINITY_DN414_c0_g1~~TRINITY_DN414_c0_g1_i1.p1  ORF type:complete len:118 (+),score=35.62 TRINITY_DN414_c0_g1_i1:558-911(+)
MVEKNFESHQSSRAVVVRNLPPKMTEIDLALLFSECVGRVVSCRIEKNNSGSATIGYVEFTSVEDQQTSISEFHDQVIELGGNEKTQNDEQHEEVALEVVPATYSTFVGVKEEEESK